mmetsp:Transcript_8759/g.12865  ORF Transcript_8759/g.12865 Transcript_8759/m.12865 type:complete len:198 (+) Transcript_8759:3-596(+)
MGRSGSTFIDEGIEMTDTYFTGVPDLRISDKTAPINNSGLHRRPDQAAGLSGNELKERLGILPNHQDFSDSQTSLRQTRMIEVHLRQSNRTISQATLDMERGATETKLGKFLHLIEPYIVFLIFINSIMIGVGTFDFVEKNPKVNEIFELVDKIFLIIFTMEVILSTAHYLRLDQADFTEGLKNPTFPPLTVKEKKN